jgi:hypothetical protein
VTSPQAPEVQRPEVTRVVLRQAHDPIFGIMSLVRLTTYAVYPNDPTPHRIEIDEWHGQVPTPDGRVLEVGLLSSNAEEIVPQIGDDIRQSVSSVLAQLPTWQRKVATGILDTAKTWAKSAEKTQPTADSLAANLLIVGVSLHENAEGFALDFQETAGLFADHAVCAEFSADGILRWVDLH